MVTVKRVGMNVVKLELKYLFEKCNVHCVDFLSVAKFPYSFKKHLSCLYHIIMIIWYYSLSIWTQYSEIFHSKRMINLETSGHMVE